MEKGNRDMGKNYNTRTTDINKLESLYELTNFQKNIKYQILLKTRTLMKEIKN